MIDDKFFIILISIFVGSITIASVLATKIINVFGFYRVTWLRKLTRICAHYMTRFTRCWVSTTWRA